MKINYGPTEQKRMVKTIRSLITRGDDFMVEDDRGSTGNWVVTVIRHGDKFLWPPLDKAGEVLKQFQARWAEMEKVEKKRRRRQKG